MKKLPPEVKFYKKTAEFTEETVPKGLLKSHQTKKGSWCKIIVLEGKLLYLILEPELQEVELNSSVFGVVEPEVSHEVRPLGKVRFYVEFYQ